MVKNKIKRYYVVTNQANNGGVCEYEGQEQTMECDVIDCEPEDPEQGAFSFDEIPSNNKLVDQIVVNINNYNKVGTCVIIEEPVNIQIVEFTRETFYYKKWKLKDDSEFEIYFDLNVQTNRDYDIRQHNKCV